MAYIPRGTDLWTEWPIVNTVNIVGDVGLSTLEAAFSLVASSRVHMITDDLTARGIPMLFTDAGTFQIFCSEAIACFLSSAGSTPPATPSPSPIILFNPAYVSEPPATLAAVLAHEGTHFQEYLDGRLFNAALGTVDNEFDAFWNAAAFWEDIRATQTSVTSPLNTEIEGVYQLALQGEAALREHIAAVYCGGAANC